MYTLKHKQAYIILGSSIHRWPVSGFVPDPRAAYDYFPSGYIWVVDQPTAKCEGRHTGAHI